MSNDLPSYYHLHLISDSTGETLITIAKAASVQYAQARPIEHMHPLVRTPRQLNRVIQEIERAPGIVLYTVVNEELSSILEEKCSELNVPCMQVLQHIMQVFEAYLGASKTPTVAGQHVLDSDYFRRIDALNFTMKHDDGQLPENLNDADIIVLGTSRTSKTPTSIYLAQRGYKTANLPLIPNVPLPRSLTEPHDALVVCLTASVDRIIAVRRNRAMLIGDRKLDQYIDRDAILDEISYSRRVCAKHGWPLIDVTRRSVEETAATIIKVLNDREATLESEASTRA